MTVVSSTIDSLVSYDWNDWEVSETEVRRAITALKVDLQFDSTITALKTSGGLKKLLSRIPSQPKTLAPELISVLASRSSSSKSTIRSEFLSSGAAIQLLWARNPLHHFRPDLFFDICSDLGLTSRTLKYANQTAIGSGAMSATSTTSPSNSSAPFTGSGATGTNPTTLSIDVIDKVALAFSHSGTEEKYGNPLGNLSSYLSSLTSNQRLTQARALVNQPISTLFPYAYTNGRPSRARVIWAAGILHNLEPELIASVILAEQRDQSRNEDAKDYIGATSFLQGNTSIGLGQVVISTARNNDLFSDIIQSSGTRKSLSHETIAALLCSDEFNIFATARYIRQVANAASRVAPSALPVTHSIFPNINLSLYSMHSSKWPFDNVLALGSEYTSNAWDDKIYLNWGNFVGHAYKTFRRSKIAFP